MAALADEKAALRRSILARRDATAAPERARLSTRITEHLLSLPAFAQAGCVLAYLSFGSEYDTAQFVAAVAAAGKRLLLPRVDRSKRRLQLYEVVDPASQTGPGTWGIREPIADRCSPAQREAAALVLAPGLAFTAAGERLGYGGGFYDRLLADWPRHPLILAGAFSLQIVPQLPIGPHDARMDRVVTEDGLLGG